MMMTTIDLAPLSFGEYLDHCQQRVQRALQRVLDDLTGTTTAASLYEAMRYSVMNGGKRVRPLLVFAAAEGAAAEGAAAESAAAGNISQALAGDLDLIACAFEFLHCYSLIHDDLPAMDDDDLRRGLPTCHKQFDEATAILAGDALQAEAFRLLSETTLPASTQMQLVRLLALASGSQGMVAGQAIDLAAVATRLDVDALEDGLSGSLRASDWPCVSGAGRCARCRKRYRDAGQTAGRRCRPRQTHLRDAARTTGRESKSGATDRRST